MDFRFVCRPSTTAATITLSHQHNHYTCIYSGRKLTAMSHTNTPTISSGYIYAPHNIAATSNTPQCIRFFFFFCTYRLFVFIVIRKIIFRYDGTAVPRMIIVCLLLDLCICVKLTGFTTLHNIV